MGLLKSLSRPAQIKLSGISNLCELGRSLLSLEQVIVSCLDSVVVVAVLTLLQAIQIPELVNLLLVASTLFFQFGQFKVSVVNLLFQGIARV